MKDYRFVIGKPTELEETRHHELKEIKGGRPVDIIKNASDEYVVAYLNSAEGRILWGIRDSDKAVVGVRLASGEKDELRRVVTDKLNQIQPPISPTAYEVNLHPVYEDESCVTAIGDTWVVEIVAPQSTGGDLYATGGGEVWVKTDGGKRKLTPQQIQDEIRRRLRQETSSTSGHESKAPTAGFVVNLNVSDEGLITDDPEEMLAMLAGAQLALDDGQPIEFDVSWEPLTAIQVALAGMQAPESAQSRMMRVELSKTTKSFEQKVKWFQEAARLAFGEPIRYSIVRPQDCAEIMHGLALQTMDSKRGVMGSVSIAVFRDDLKIGTTVHLNEGEVQDLLRSTRQPNIWFLTGNFGWDFYHLPRQVQYGNAIPAILLAVTNRGPSLDSVNLEEVLDLGSWRVGLA